MKNDLSKKYSKGTIATHWLSAILILALFPLGKIMEDMDIVEKAGLAKIHIAMGLIIFVLTVIRTFAYFKHKRPADLDTGSKINDKLAVWIHNIFYFLLFGISISGIATMILGGYGDAFKSGNLALVIARSEIAPLKAHGIMATIMMILLVLHVVGAIKHYILTKENTLKRIS